MDIASIKEYLGQDWTAVSESIRSILHCDIELLNSTNASILSHSGKQLRPLLALMFARACNAGHVSEATVRYAASSELMHNATLLHDDVADDSDQRRGVPTIMSLKGPSVSVLVGDYDYCNRYLGVPFETYPKRNALASYFIRSGCHCRFALYLEYVLPKYDVVLIFF